MNNTLPEVINAADGLHRRLDTAEETPCVPDDRAEEILGMQDRGVKAENQENARATLKL